LFDYESQREIAARRPRLDRNSGPLPGLGEILAMGKRLALEEGARRGTVVGDPIAVMSLLGPQSRLILRSGDPSCEVTTTDKCLVVEFNSQTGAIDNFRTGEQLQENGRIGNVVSHWLHELHVAHSLGMAYQLFVFIIGIVIAMLSVTGIYIWWKKRSVRRSRQASPQPELAEA
jgi:hypothetical protein